MKNQNIIFLIYFILLELQHHFFNKVKQLINLVHSQLIDNIMHFHQIFIILFLINLALQFQMGQILLGLLLLLILILNEEELIFEYYNHLMFFHLKATFLNISISTNQVAFKFCLELELLDVKFCQIFKHQT